MLFETFVIERSRRLTVRLHDYLADEYAAGSEVAHARLQAGITLAEFGRCAGRSSNQLDKTLTSQTRGIKLRKPIEQTFAVAHKTRARAEALSDS